MQIYPLPQGESLCGVISWQLKQYNFLVMVSVLAPLLCVRPTSLLYCVTLRFILFFLRLCERGGSAVEVL